MTQWTFNTAIEEIESCGFECEAGSIKNSTAWRWLKNALKEPDDLPRPRIADIKAIVSAHFKLAQGRLEGPELVREVSIPRHIAYRLVRIHTLRSYPLIGREFGGRDHTSVISGIVSIGKRMAENPELRDAYEAIDAKIVQLVLPNSKETAHG